MTLRSTPQDKIRNQIIGLAGPKGVGKSHVASQLKNSLNATILSYADPIRDALSAIGVRFDVDKEAEQKPFGKSARFMAQTFGTEWGRETVSKSIWLDVMRMRIDETDGVVIIDDVRFDNEASQIDGLGGVVIKLHGDTCYEWVDHHSSEAGVCYDLVDRYVYNSRINPTLALETILSFLPTK